VTDSAPVVVDAPAASRFEILVDGAVAGFAEYRRTSSSVSFTHTVVDPAFEGRGLGSVLARGVLDASREAGLTVLPFCPFIRSYIRRHPAYLDLVPAGRRAEFGLAPAPAPAADQPTPDPRDVPR
jgi:predicted GNAT family acetyltransferase